jgi:hypothetical protein
LDEPTTDRAIDHLDMAPTTPALLNRMAQLQLQMHGHPATQFASLKARLAANVQRASLLGESRQINLLAGFAKMSAGDCLCNGAFHPYNIMGPLGCEVLIDWLAVSRGEPAADVCRSYMLLRHAAPEMTSAYFDAYSHIGGASRSAILNWLPFVAAVRLAEGVPEVTI